MITKSQVLKWLEATAAMIEENRQYLTELDSPIGDADHGINMDRGFKKVMSKLPGVEDKDIGTILKTSGMALVTSVGGAGGPLYGTFLMDAGKAVTGKEELSNDDLVALLDAGLKGVIRIGKTNLEDKTMVDALHPALEALKKAVADGKDTGEALHLMTDAAHEGMKDTIPMLARKGRASYLGERSIGHQDPGATSSYLLLKTLTETIEADPSA
ncbi:MAG: dihydroxyacetone kinase subunit L [Anaerolineales bacterium]|nr:MAG: dihydroxyacetone kinase subunit L [Anaerolineales bacterium]